MKADTDIFIIMQLIQVKQAHQIRERYIMMINNLMKTKVNQREAISWCCILVNIAEQGVSECAVLNV